MPEEYEKLDAEPYPMWSTPDVSHVTAHAASGLVMAVVQDTLTFRNVETGEQTHAPVPVSERVLRTELSPDGTRAVVGTCESFAKVIDVATGEEICRTPATKDYLDNVLWLPDGARFVGVSQQLEAAVYDAATGEMLVPILTEAVYESLFGTALSPDGGTLYLASGSRLRAFNTESGAQVWEHNDSWTKSNPAVSPDGQWIVVSSNRLELIRAADGAVVVQGPEFDHHGGIQYPGQIGMATSWSPRPSWSPDGSRVAVNLPNGQFGVFQANTCGPLQIYPRTESLAWIEDVDWLADGDTVLLGTSHNHLLRFSVSQGQVVSDWEGRHVSEEEAAALEKGGGPSPVIAAAASWFFPGVGQMLAGQTIKGIVLLVVNFFTCYLFGLGGIICAIDAYLIAKKLEDGKEVGDWEFF